MLQVNTLVPIILTGILGFTVFLIPSDDIEKRLSAHFWSRIAAAHCAGCNVHCTARSLLGIVQMPPAHKLARC